jgi:hypothetical protein
MKILARSLPKTFRRAGIQFTENEQKFDVDEKTLLILESEKMLVVKRIAEDDGDDLNAMTVAQLTEALVEINPDIDLKGLKKADLIEKLKELRK